MFVTVLLWILLYFVIGIVGGVAVIRFWSKRDHNRFHPSRGNEQNEVIALCGVGMLFWPFTLVVLGTVGLWIACERLTRFLFRFATRTTG